MFNDTCFHFWKERQKKRKMNKCTCSCNIGRLDPVKMQVWSKMENKDYICWCLWICIWCNVDKVLNARDYAYCSKMLYHVSWDDKPGNSSLFHFREMHLSDTLLINVSFHIMEYQVYFTSQWLYDIIIKYFSIS